MLLSSLGSHVWLGIGIVVAAWLVVTVVAGHRSVPGPRDVVRWFLSSWLGRLLMLALWAEAGWHLFTQRP